MIKKIGMIFHLIQVLQKKTTTKKQMNLKQLHKNQNMKRKTKEILIIMDYILTMGIYIN